MGLPAEIDVDELSEAAEKARSILAVLMVAGNNLPPPTPEEIEAAFWALDNALYDRDQ